jgi:hypothetical protein
MSVMEKLKALFQREDLPEETRQLYSKTDNSRDLVKGLETLRGRNEIDLREYEGQLLGIEKAIVSEEQSIRKGGLSSAEETILLRRIERLRKQRANIERQSLIYNENVNLHLNLIAKIQELEAMRLRGVSEDEIDSLVEEVEANVQDYKRVSIAAESGSAIAPAIDEPAERRRLEELKKQIVGDNEPSRPPIVEAPPPKRNLE